MTDITTTVRPGDIIESVIAKGDLARLTPEERTRYYVEVCKSVGLNPFTRPLEYIMLSGKLTLYARREAADQLRQIHGISIEIISQKVDGDLLIVHAKARDKSGRTDEDFGAVNVAGLRGEARANGMLKAITKAKRRVTLSIAGLGFLDETEIDDIPAREKEPVSVGVDLDAFAAEQIEAPAATPDERLAKLAAGEGTVGFRDWWQQISKERRDRLRPNLAHYQEIAVSADTEMALAEIPETEPGRAPPEPRDGPHATPRRRGRPPGPEQEEPGAVEPDEPPQREVLFRE
jgi:hypothetical protein